MIDLQLSLSGQFEMGSDIKEQVEFCKNYETEMDNYSR